MGTIVSPRVPTPPACRDAMVDGLAAWARLADSRGTSGGVPPQLLARPLLHRLLARYGDPLSPAEAQSLTAVLPAAARNGALDARAAADALQRRFAKTLKS